MPARASTAPLIAIACGGTGGHFFPGLAVAEELLLRGCDVMLLISPKEVDQEAVKSAAGMQVAILPAVGMTRRNLPQFLVGGWRSYCAARKLFRTRPPQAVLAMGGFTSAPPVLAGQAGGAVTFLHESNTIPGKANRWLAHFVHQVFIGFPQAAGRLHHSNVLHTGTPVRPQFEPGDPGAARIALGLRPERPLVLVMGGSQGATGVNDLVLAALPHLLRAVPDAQFLHLTGPADTARVQAAYNQHQARALVRPFLTEMELAMTAATVAVSRAGASSLAELAALRLPAVLIPFPAAADNHQLSNARAFTETGAALLLEQKSGTGEQLSILVRDLLIDERSRETMSHALHCWHTPHAAELMAERMLALLDSRKPGQWKFSARP